MISDRRRGFLGAYDVRYAIRHVAQVARVDFAPVDGDYDTAELRDVLRPRAQHRVELVNLTPRLRVFRPQRVVLGGDRARGRLRRVPLRRRALQRVLAELPERRAHLAPPRRESPEPRRQRHPGDFHGVPEPRRYGRFQRQ